MSKILMIEPEKKKPMDIFVFLPFLALCADLFTPLLIWKNFLLPGTCGLSKKYDFGLSLIFAVALPVVLITGAVPVPVTSVFFKHGAFQHSNILCASQIILAFLLGNVFLRMVGNVFQFRIGWNSIFIVQAPKKLKLIDLRKNRTDGRMQL
jgi:hypothetical protein